MSEFNTDFIPEMPLRPDRVFQRAETVFAWLSLTAGYAFCRVFPAVTAPLGAFLFLTGLYITTAIIIKLRKGSLKGMCLISGLSALLIALSMLFTDNSFILFFAYLYSLGTYGYFIYAAFGNAAEQGFSDLLLLDFFKALLVAPFQSFGQLFKVIFRESSFGGKSLLKILAGIALATVPTILIVSLLSYDSGFSAILESIFTFGFQDIFSHIGSFILGIPIGMYLYGIFISSVDRKCTEILTADSCRKAVQSIRFVPTLTVLSAAAPILIVYILFFISQWKYYISGFVGVLPNNFSYAEYAREGFFQLCAVSMINFLIISAIGLFIRRRSKKSSPVQRILSIILSLFTLVLIATAIAKMILYIDVYGLTPKRVYATWFMAVLALLFILVIIKQFILRLKMIAISAGVVVFCFAVLSFSNMEGIIANYNVDRYLNGTLDDADAEALSDLGDAAIPAMIRLVTTQDQKYGTDFLNYEGAKGVMPSGQYLQYQDFCDHLREMTLYRENSFWSVTIPQLKADSAIKKSGLDTWIEENRSSPEINEEASYTRVPY